MNKPSTHAAMEESHEMGLLPAETPAALGYRMPAEWEPHQATWLSWPHKEESWPGLLPEAERTMAQAVRHLAASETVHINVLGAEHEGHVRGLLDEAQAAGDIRFHHFPTNDAWVRDHGAIFVVRERNGRREMAATDWGYNAWGGKYPPYDLDNTIPGKMAETLGVPRYEGGMILEGGSIEVNGTGTLLTTEACLLNPNRNPHLSKAEIEQRLRDFLGVSKILWLGDGIVGDDTDGHVDDLTRFVDERTVVTVVEEDPQDENYSLLQENLERLRGMTTLDGTPLRVIELPMPRPVFYTEQRLPASYANFYIANGLVLLPVFDEPNDRVAERILQELFPDRKVIGINSRNLVWGLGAFHCLTQQIPAV